jgi:hypothetical protein
MKPDNKVLLRSIWVILLSQLAYINLVNAQIYECNGTWTNQPCAGATIKFEESKSIKGTQRSSSQHNQAIVHELVQARYKAKERYSLDISTDAAEKFCKLAETTLDQCQERVDQELDIIESKIIEIKKLELQQEELELRRQELEDRAGETNNTVVIQNIFLLTPTPRASYTGHIINQPIRLPLVKQNRTPAPSRGEVVQDARVPRK